MVSSKTDFSYVRFCIRKEKKILGYLSFFIATLLEKFLIHSFSNSYAFMLVLCLKTYAVHAYCQDIKHCHYPSGSHKINGFQI